METQPRVTSLTRRESAEVEIDGPIVRCFVYCSFQSFLVALRGHEVISLKLTPITL